MSTAYSRRTRNNPYTKDTTDAGGCYAIANPSSPSSSGIYFSREEATKKILGSEASFQKFDKVKDAEAFLKDRGFVPKIESGGWISARNKQPILYTPLHSSSVVDDDNESSSDPHRIIVSPANANADSDTSRRAMPLECSHQTPQPQRSMVEATRKDKTDLRQLWSQHEHQRDRVFAAKDPNQQQRHNALNPIISIDSSPDSQGPFVSSTSKYFQEEPLNKKRQRRPRPRSESTSSVSALENTHNESDLEDSVQSKASKKKKKEEPAAEPPKFDVVQQRAIDAAMIGKNVFLTGVAGTGKSLVTKKIVEDAKHMRKEVAVAAPTGVAAVNLGPELGAQTVHSLAGVGVPQTASGFEKMLTPWTAKKWRKIQVLVLDEIGMLGADFLDWMDVYVRKARKKPLEPFGGIQLIFVGDFAQLGPIAGRGHSLRNRAFEPHEPGADCLMGVHECAAYAFQTVLWREADFHHVHLRKVYRQKNKDFQLALMDIREAKADSQRVKDLVDTCSAPLGDRQGLEIPEGIKPTILYCTNRNVDNENFENLARLPDRGKIFEAKDSTSISGDIKSAGRDVVERMLTQNSFFKDCSASRKIHLKLGAQVMLLQNLDLRLGLVNGSRGVVEKFALCPVVKDIIHGEEMLIGPNDVDKFPGCRFEDLKFNQKTDFEGKIWRICRFDRYPLVRFVNNVSRIIVPETFERVLYRQGSCMRKQIPLRLAWALTIHKSQGATLDYVVCDLQGCFTSGQAYVALSRARSMLGLEIKNFSSRHVTADPLVEAFYDALDRHDMKNFLQEQAGLWWFPILKAPTWLHMFERASGKTAKVNAQQFRSWVAEYKPLDGYRGWGA